MSVDMSPVLRTLVPRTILAAPAARVVRNDVHTCCGKPPSLLRSVPDAEWQSSIDIVLQRFAEFHALQGAFGRRALIERAKGILMERHAIDERKPAADDRTASAENRSDSG